MTDWQPIETAPRDGTRIILGNPDWSTVWTGRYDAERPVGEPEYRWKDLGPRWQRTGFTDISLAPTYWQPLPDPPND